MSIAQVGSVTTAGNGSATSLACNKPTGVASGHLMIAFVTTNNDTISAPAGWTSIIHDDNGATATFGDAWYYRVAGGSEGSTYTFTKSGSTAPMVVSIVALSGVDTSSPIDGSAGSVATTSNPASTPSYSDTVVSGRSFYSRSVRNLSGSGIPTLSSATSGQALLTTHGATGTTPSYGHGIFWATSDFTGGTHSPSTISISSSNTPTDSINSGFVVNAVGVSVAADQPSASVTANAATVQISNVITNSVSVSANDSTVTVGPAAELASASAAASDVVRSIPADSPSAAVVANSASIHLDAYAESSEASVSVLGSIAYYGAPVVRLYVVPGENRTYYVRR